MLYANGKKANRLQNCMHAFYFECKKIKEAIEQYEFLSKLEDNELDNLMDKYPKLFFTSIESMRYRIIIGLGNIVDNYRKGLSFNKIINMSEQEGNREINSVIRNVKEETRIYDELIDNIRLLRDKMYAHIDINYSLEEEEIFDMDFEFLNNQIKKSKEYIKFVMKTCVEISKEYDGDSIHLGINWIYDK